MQLYCNAAVLNLSFWPTPLKNDIHIRNTISWEYQTSDDKNKKT